jgi:hypothetical protein
MGGLTFQEADRSDHDEVGYMEDDAPDAYVCPIGMCMLNVDPVVASDGFIYSRAALEGWIEQCQATGRPLTSPKTNEVKDAAFLPNTRTRCWCKTGSRPGSWRTQRRECREGVDVVRKGRDGREEGRKSIHVFILKTK